MAKLTFYTVRSTQQSYPLRFSVTLEWVDVIPWRRFTYTTCDPNVLAVFRVGELTTLDMDNAPLPRDWIDHEAIRMMDPDFKINPLALLSSTQGSNK